MTAMVGASPAFRDLLALVDRFAPTGHPILILGAPGSGKTALAREIHRRSRRTGPLVRFPLSNVPDELRHTELFGHARGAFTGADRERAGAVEQAHRGTLFLDEIGLASPGSQAALLTVLDDAAVRRIGEDHVRRVDVRIVAATNEDLEGRTAAGTFRKDLLARFGYFQLEVPLLRDRPDDILPLFRHFLQVEQGLRGEPEVPRLEARVEAVLQAAPWNDNVRELANVARYVLASRAGGEAICLEHLPRRFLSTIREGVASMLPSERVAQALNLAGGNRSQAAVILGVSRATLYRYLGSVAEKAG